MGSALELRGEIFELIGAFRATRGAGGQTIASTPRPARSHLRLVSPTRPAAPLLPLAAERAPRVSTEAGPATEERPDPTGPRTWRVPRVSLRLAERLAAQRAAVHALLGKYAALPAEEPASRPRSARPAAAGGPRPRRCWTPSPEARAFVRRNQAARSDEELAFFLVWAPATALLGLLLLSAL